MEEIKTNDRAEFLKERLSGIGGTDASAIAGLNPYKTPLDVYLEKKELVDPIEENEAMYWGKKQESIIAERYAKEHGVTLIKHDGFIRHPKYNFMIGHPDYLVVDKNGNVCRGVEIKTVGLYSWYKWGEPGTDEAPVEHIIQTTHYSAICEELYGIKPFPFDIPVLAGGQIYAEFQNVPPPSMIKNLITIEDDFWENHVLAGIPPEIDGSDSSKKYLSSLYPADRGEVIPADEKAETIADQLRQAEEKLKEAKGSHQLYQNLLKDIIRDASTLVGRDWRISWKKAKDTKKIDWEAVASDFWQVIKDNDYSAKDFFETTVRSQTEIKPGSRRFLTKWGVNDNSENKEKKNGDN